MSNRHPIRRGALALLAALALPGCAVFRDPPPLTPETAYQQGIEAYEAGRYGRAATLLSQFTVSVAADPRLKPALMALGRSHLETGEYVTAAADFLRIVSEFPRDPEAIQARFLLCDTYRRLSPKPALDQEYTRSAVAYCQSYADLYPQTPEAEQARAWVAELRTKLARKAYQNGIFYLRRGLYDAAVIYFTEAVDQYPETAVAPEALAKIVEAYDRIGYREEAEAARERLRRQYPQSEAARALAAG